MNEPTTTAEDGRRPRSLWRPRPSGLPFFSPWHDEPRERSGSDVVVLILTLLPVLALGWIAVPQSAFEKAVVEVIDTVPPYLDVLWRLGVGGLIVWCLIVVTAAAVRRRGDVLLDVLLSAVIGVLLALVADHRITGSWPTVSEIFTGGSAGSIPLVALVLAAAVSSAAAPHLSRPPRMFGRWAVWYGVASIVILGSTTPSGGFASVLLGMGSAAVVHLALGSSVGRPTVADVAAALDQLDLDVVGLVAAPRQHTGVFVVDGTGPDGEPVRVSVYGRDARDTQLLGRIWRSAWYRGAGAVDLSRLQQVEHEGFVTLLAASRGVPVPRVLVAGRTDRNDALIAVADVGAPLDSVDHDSLVDDVVEQVWDIVDSLHASGLAHGAISVDTFGLDTSQVDTSRDDTARVVLNDLGSVTVSASDDQRRTDQALVVVSTALLVGIERAVVIAGDRLGTEGVAAMLPYLQVAALGAPLRKALKSSEVEMDAIRSAAAAVVDVEVPEIAKLRRVSPQTLVTLGLVVLVAFALITSLGDVDVDELRTAFSEAAPGLAIAAILVAQLPFLSQAVATRGACPRFIPYGPVAMLQFAIGFIALAVPSTAGRLALDLRFFQRQGVPATSAVSIAAIDGFSGFLVQVALLIATLVLGVGQVDLTVKAPTGGGSGNLMLVLGIAAALFVLAAIAAVALPVIRNRILDRIRPMLTEVRDTVASLRSPSKLLQLFGGNLANQVLFALALGVSLRAFGGHLNLATLVVVYVAAALFGGLMPVPGGIGVVEAALMAGLVAAGVEATTATATALLFRAATFYLPPIWGWMALRWLQRRSYL